METSGLLVLAFTKEAHRNLSIQFMESKVEKNPNGIVIKNTQKTKKDLKQEHLYVIYLDLKGKVTAIKNLTIGTISSTLIDANLIFKWAYKLSSTNFILVHNHPSGDATPSIADIKLTIDLVKKSKIINLEVVDHVIIGDEYFSMRKNLKDIKVF